MNQVFILTIFAAIVFYSFDTAPISAAVKKNDDAETKKADTVTIKTDTTLSISDGLIFSLDSNQFDFGDIANYSQIQVIFYARNISNSPILIEDAKTSCGCDWPTIQREPIQPGEEARLIYSYHSHRRIGPGIKMMTVQYESKQPYLLFKFNVLDVFPFEDNSQQRTPRYVVEKPFDRVAFVKEISSN